MTLSYYSYIQISIIYWHCQNILIYEYIMTMSIDNRYVYLQISLVYCHCHNILIYKFSLSIDIVITYSYIQTNTYCPPWILSLSIENRYLYLRISFIYWHCQIILIYKYPLSIDMVKTFVYTNILYLLTWSKYSYIQISFIYWHGQNIRIYKRIPITHREYWPFIPAIHCIIQCHY